MSYDDTTNRVLVFMLGSGIDRQYSTIFSFYKRSGIGSSVTETVLESLQVPCGRVRNRFVSN